MCAFLVSHDCSLCRSLAEIPNPLPCVANGKTGALNAGHPGVGGNDRAATPDDPVALFGTTRLFGVALIGTIGVRVSNSHFR
jgi:hypothetical protein